MDNRPTIAEVQEWVLKLHNTCEQTITNEERKEQHKYAVMVQRPQDKKFLVKMLDESSQIRDRKKLATRIKTLIDRYGVPEFLNKRDTFLFKMYQAFGHHFDFIAIPIIKKRLRMDTSKVILDEARPKLTRHLSERAQQKVGQLSQAQQQKQAIHISQLVQSAISMQLRLQTQRVRQAQSISQLR